jgi:hypothetical protein
MNQRLADLLMLFYILALLGSMVWFFGGLHW